jgi:hypothetical protein
MLQNSRNRSMYDLPLLTRYSDNPILSGHDWPYAVNSVFNAGAVRLPDGDTCCFAAWKTAAACRTCARRVLRMESTDGVSIPSRR